MRTKRTKLMNGFMALVITCSLTFATSCKQDVKNSKTSTFQSDPLPSWNDGDLKQAIVDYVNKVTTEGTADFIPVIDRIATFDNDGTLWPEKPIIQGEFAKYRAVKMLEADPKLAQKQPFKAIATKDLSYFQQGGLKAFAELIIATQTGMNVDDFYVDSKAFFDNFKYPKYDLTGKQLAYKPQLELLEYLRSNGFTTYICTGGDIDFVRSISSDFYGIPANQIIGSAMVYKYDETSRRVIRTSQMLRMNDQQTKPDGIQLYLGKRPVFACGNEGGKGDIQMLEYSQSSPYPTFQMIVNHNDSIREFAYSEPDNASLNASAKNNWHVIDMANDWKVVFNK